jgi:kynurenine formamidase
LKIYDLSSPIDPRSGDPIPPRIDYQDHDAGVPHLARLLGVDPSEVPDGKGSATEMVHTRTHTGTHLDAPYHYFPTCEGRPARTIDEVPLEWCFGDGVVLDLHEKPAGSEITPEDLQRALDAIGYRLKPGDIVFIRTGADRHFYSPDYPRSHAGMGRDATLWLIERGIRVMGIDAWAWDLPLPIQGERFIRSGRRDPSTLWAAHRVGKDHEFLHLEQMANLDALPRPFGFRAAVFPIKVSRGSAGWVRAVAIFEDL